MSRMITDQECLDKMFDQKSESSFIGKTIRADEAWKSPDRLKCVLKSSQFRNRNRRRGIDCRTEYRAIGYNSVERKLLVDNAMVIQVSLFSL